MIEGRRVRGEMLWFNEEKGHGYIRTEDDERLYVDAAGFPDGHPVGSCAGLPVEFVIDENGGERRALEAQLVEEVAPRRARRRGSR